MSETSLKPVIDKLENLFSKFNEKFYNGELQTPTQQRVLMVGVLLGKRGATSSRNRKRRLTLRQ